MKKVLIISHAMELGGVERSLLGLLDAFDYSKYQVDLFLLRHEGELLSMIPEQVNILHPVPSYTVLARPMVQTLKEGHILLTTARLHGKIKAQIYSKKHNFTDSAVAIEYSHKYIKKYLPPIQPDVTYDLCISFLTPHYFAAEKVKAKKRIAWIHTDYTTVQIDKSSELAMWDKMDNIISISPAVTESFVKVFPELENKITLIENILPQKLIMKQADEPIGDEMPKNGKPRLLSVGRFCHAKNFDNIPEICSILKQLGIEVNWYLIGYGGDEELIRRKIEQFNMQDTVIILGKKDNPYPYIKDCDLYVQPSRYEGKCVAAREAQMLGKPVVITNYATSAGQLENGVDGIIVPLDNEACAKGIADVLNNPKLIHNLSEACKNRSYANTEETEKLYQLILD